MKEYHINDTEQIVQSFLAGEVLAFPTDTVFGVGVIYGKLDSLKALKEIKKRPDTKPIPMMCSSLEQAESFAEIPESARKLADAFLPGAMTLIVPLKEDADRRYTNGMDTVALRIPDAPWLLEVMKKLPLPLLVSSANLSGEPTVQSAAQAKEILPGLDGVADGTCREGRASTIVDCTKNPPVIVRPGPITQSEIEAVY